jgi:hypothetical protein
MHSINLPFWLAAACAAFPLVFIQLFLQRDGAAAAQPGAAVWSPSVLLRDRALLWFTCSGLLASFVGGAFASCISQYVLVVASSDFAEKVVAVVLPVNAAVVVALQYAVGRRLSARNIRPLMTFGTVCFVIGLVGFMFSGASLWAWGISAAIFTLGGDLCPGEYMLIDHCPAGDEGQLLLRPVAGLAGRGIQPDADRDDPHPSAALVAFCHSYRGDCRRLADDFPRDECPPLAAGFSAGQRLTPAGMRLSGCCRAVVGSLSWWLAARFTILHHRFTSAERHGAYEYEQQQSGQTITAAARLVPGAAGRNGGSQRPHDPAH